MPGGRPSDYNEETAARLLTAIATQAKGLRTICKQEGMPSVRTVFQWLMTHEEFSHHYTRAKAEQAELMGEDLIDISDDGTNDTYTDENGVERVNNDVIQRSKLRVETRKWLMSKLLPKKYGERVDVTSGGEALPAPAPAINFVLPAAFVQRRGRQELPP